MFVSPCIVVTVLYMALLVIPSKISFVKTFSKQIIYSLIPCRNKYVPSNVPHRSSPIHQLIPCTFLCGSCIVVFYVLKEWYMRWLTNHYPRRKISRVGLYTFFGFIVFITLHVTFHPKVFGMTGRTIIQSLATKFL